MQSSIGAAFTPGSLRPATVLYGVQLIGVDRSPLSCKQF